MATAERASQLYTYGWSGRGDPYPMYGALNGAYEPKSTRGLVRAGRSALLPAISPDRRDPGRPRAVVIARTPVTTRNVAARLTVRPATCRRDQRWLPRTASTVPATT